MKTQYQTRQRSVNLGTCPNKEEVVKGWIFEEVKNMMKEKNLILN